MPSRTSSLAEPAYTNLAGRILFLPKYEDAEKATPGVTAKIDINPEGYDHPVLILSKWLDTSGNVLVLTVTSLGDQTIAGKFDTGPEREHIRSSFIPIEPSPPHPDSGLLLRVETGCHLRKPSNVSIKKVISVPNRILHPDRRAPKARLSGASMRVVFDKVAAFSEDNELALRALKVAMISAANAKQRERAARRAAAVAAAVAAAEAAAEEARSNRQLLEQYPWRAVQPNNPPRPQPPRPQPSYGMAYDPPRFQPSHPQPSYGTVNNLPGGFRQSNVAQSRYTPYSHPASSSHTANYGRAPQRLAASGLPESTPSASPRDNSQNSWWPVAGLLLLGGGFLLYKLLF